MSKKRITFALAVLVVLAWTECGFGKDESGPDVLPDGFILSGADGKLARQDGNDIWLFEFDSDVSGDDVTLKAHTRLTLLPSLTLQEMITDLTQRRDAYYRLWARVTEYRDRNYIFPIYFLPLAKPKQPAGPPGEPNEPIRPAVNDPNDTLAIPSELLERLKTRRTIQQKQTATVPAKGKADKSKKQNIILNNRVGFLRDLGQAKADEPCKLSFVLDGLGRNVSQTSFRLLPCQVLERMEKQLWAEPGSFRFRVAAILTEYKGNTYLLPHRATRVYSYGNFGR